MPDIRVGFVGVGMMSQVCHIPCFQQAEGCEVTALVSSRSGLLGQVADGFGIGKRYASHAELAADPDIDLAAVILPPEYNPQVCIDLLEAGKHVFCEKPVSLAVADAERMQAAAQAAGRLLMVGFMKRYDAGVQAAKAQVDGWRESGEAGEMLFARAHSFIGGDWLGNIGGLLPQVKTDEKPSEKPAVSLPEWLSEEYGGAWGPYYFFNHVHSHDMDLLTYFLGREFEVRHADWSRATKLALLDFDGVAANLEVAKAGANRRWDEELRVYFEHGWVHVQVPPPMLINAPAQVQVYHMGERQEMCDVHAPYSWSFLRQAQGAVDSVAGKAEPLCTIEDGVAQMRMTEGIFRMV